MKLEIRHLAPYLAHKVKFKINVFGQLIEEGIMVGLNHKEIEFSEIRKTITESFAYSFCSPILYPLSEVMDINSPLFNRINTDLKIQMEICDLANKQIGYWDLSYSAFDVMCENHIDFFRLIDEGLATDINTLKD